ncbi:MAG TPA: hypothetical protein VFL82_03475 [Thermomicrobiales bacterium]|nr:hypothetical protein [Thermomicrobiales bacterium]
MATSERVQRDGDTVTVRDYLYPGNTLTVAPYKNGYAMDVREIELSDDMAGVITSRADFIAFCREGLALAGEGETDDDDPDPAVFGPPNRTYRAKVRIRSVTQGEMMAIDEDGEPDWEALAVKLWRFVEAYDDAWRADVIAPFIGETSSAEDRRIVDKLFEHRAALIEDEMMLMMAVEGAGDE